MSRPSPDYRQLSISERIQLVEDIWDSIAAEAPDSIGLSPSQREEIVRRVLAHESDPSSAVEWSAVRTELFQRNH